MSIFNQVTDTVGAVRVFREAQAPDKYVTISDNFAKSFNILQLQLLPSDSCKMWEGRANVGKIALFQTSISSASRVNPYYLLHLWWMQKRLFVYLVLTGRFYPRKRPLLSDFWK